MGRYDKKYLRCDTTSVRDTKVGGKEYTAVLNEELAKTEDSNDRAKIKKQIQDYEKELQNALKEEIDNINELYQIWEDGWNQITEKCEKYINKL